MSCDIAFGRGRFNDLFTTKRFRATMSSDMSHAPLQRRRPRQRDAAYERIKRDILQCALEPGTEVSETQLARRYGVGKASVRAALLRLDQEGFVQAFAQRGHLITPVTVRDIHAMFEFRLLLEPAVARLAAGRIGEVGVVELKRLQEADYQTGLAFNRSNTEFHLLIARAIGNQRILEALTQLHEQIERLVYLKHGPSDLVRAIAEHRRIIEALATGDGPAAELAMAEHIENANRDFLQSVYSSPGVMAVHVRGR